MEPKVITDGGFFQATTSHTSTLKRQLELRFHKKSGRRQTIDKQSVEINQLYIPNIAKYFEFHSNFHSTILKLDLMYAIDKF
jgi:hypothetical protein